MWRGVGLPLLGHWQQGEEEAEEERVNEHSRKVGERERARE